MKKAAVITMENPFGRRLTNPKNVQPPSADASAMADITGVSNAETSNRPQTAADRPPRNARAIALPR